jgi:CBS domain-containing protein
MTGSGDIEANWSRKKRTGSTVTLFSREMERRGMELTPLDSTVMLIGLYEDTGHLTFPSTSAEDARAAAFLLENKADLNVAGFFLNPPYEENQKEILFEMMKETTKYTIGNHVVGFNCIALGKKVPNLAAIVNMYRKIVNVDALFVIFTGDDRNSVIGRSGVENIHIGKVMLSLGGGGHAGAGSATLKASELSPAQIQKKIITLLSATTTESISIADIMSFPVISVSPDTPMRKIQSIMAAEKIRGVVVMNGDEIQGIIVLWDLKKIKKDRQWDSPVKAFMTRNVITVDPWEAPAKAARLMIENDVGYLPVVQQNRVIGIVTRTDILTYYYDLLPE